MHFTETAFEPYILSKPTVPVIPLICDSPHSGVMYPADFNACIPMSILRSGEDTFVEELWASIPDVGGTLLAATFPRTYIDPNREVTDIDPDMLAEPWPHVLSPTEKSSRHGHGLIWKTVRETPIYDRKLWVAEVENRIGSYYWPYHTTLNELIEEAVRNFGCVWHLNLHSMPSDTYEMLGVTPDIALADFVLGDRNGTTCDPTLLGIVEDFLQTAGHTVARNEPYRGATLVKQAGRPHENRNSLQIEINRKLYMNETTYEKSSDFDELQETLENLSLHIAQFVRQLL